MVYIIVTYVIRYSAPSVDSLSIFRRSIASTSFSVSLNFLWLFVIRPNYFVCAHDVCALFFLLLLDFFGFIAFDSHGFVRGLD